MKVLLILLSVFTAGLIQAQSLNDYKYVVVDSIYEFQTSANQYRLNEMMVFEIKKRGMVAFLNTTDLPADLNKDSCNALFLKVKVRGRLSVKMILEFVNCDDEVVFTSMEGKSSINDYQKAYRDALRDAMTSLDEVGYSYTQPSVVNRPSGRETPIQVTQASSVPVELNIKTADKTIDEEISSIPKPEFVELVGDHIYTTDSKEFKIQSTDIGFNVFKNNSLIGSLKKSQSGCYLAVTTEFMGIGYERNGDVVIEYDKNGIQFLVFKKQ